MEGESAGHLLATIVKSRSSHIARLVRGDGEVVVEGHDVIAVLRDFYGHLYSSSPNNCQNSPSH